jgi:hypothetical protein
MHGDYRYVFGYAKLDEKCSVRFTLNNWYICMYIGVRLD